MASESWRQRHNRENLTRLLSIEDPLRISLFDRSSLLLLIVTALWFGIAYFSDPSVPGNRPDGPVGWLGWWDQGQYYKCTVDLAGGQLKPENYWFGYPLLGVPFYWLLPRQPYFIPNLILILVMVGSYFASCRHVVSRPEAWVLVVLFIFVEPFMHGSLIIPWNTLPAYAALYLSAYLLLFNRPTLAHFAWCALFSGEALFSRPTEIFPLATLYLVALFGLSGWPKRLAALTFFGLAAIAAAAISLGLNLHLYGQWSSPYMALESQKFHLDHYGLKAYQLFCDGRFLTGQGALPNMDSLSIGERFPVFLFCLPGLLYLTKTGGVPMWGLILAIGSSAAFYLTYSTFANTPYFWTYSSHHYIWWIIPWLGLVSYLSFRHARARLAPRLFLVTLLAPVLLFLLIGFKTKTIAASDSPRQKLESTSSYADQTYTVDLVAPARMEALDLRLEFQTPPSYDGRGTSVVSDSKVKVWVNDQRQLTMPDYFMSQDGANFDFSFLIHGLALNPGDRIRVQFAETDQPTLIRASLLDVVFKLGRFSE
jgi:hypothetical protein